MFWLSVESWTCGLKTLYFLLWFRSLDSLVLNHFSQVRQMNASKKRLGAIVLKVFCCAAILQSIARKNKWPLDRMSLSVDVTKKTKDDYGHPPREGAYIYGLFIEGKHKLYSNVNFLFVWMNVTRLAHYRCSLG